MVRLGLCQKLQDITVNLQHHHPTNRGKRLACQAAPLDPRIIWRRVLLCRHRWATFASCLPSILWQRPPQFAAWLVFLLANQVRQLSVSRWGCNEKCVCVMLQLSLANPWDHCWAALPEYVGLLIAHGAAGDNLPGHQPPASTPPIFLLQHNCNPWARWETTSTLAQCAHYVCLVYLGEKWYSCLRLLTSEHATLKCTFPT